MKPLLATVPLLLSVSAILAQSHFQPGKILPNTGDTLSGWIDYQEWRVNPREITFRTTPQGTPAEYRVADLRYVEVTGFDTYERAVVTKDMRPILEGDFDSGSRDSTATDTVFLRTLVRGKHVSLYELVDTKAHYYVRTPQGDFTELMYKRFMAADGTHIQEVTQYRNQLVEELPDGAEPSLVARIDRCGYNAKNLTEVVLALNGAGNITSVSATVKKSGTVFRFHGSVAAYSNGLSFSGTNGDDPVGASFSHTVVPAVSLGVDLVRTRNNGDLALRVEAGYWQATYTGHKTDAFAMYTFTMKQAVISPGLALLYSFYRTDKLRLYGAAALIYNLSAGTPTDQEDVKPLAGGGTPYTENAATVEKVWMQPQLRVGAQLANKVGVELVGALPTTVRSYDFFKGVLSQYGLKVSYYLNGTH
ncbi:hypothetical protein [Dinghuibacter silviterrae]|uniref:Outer membrane protein with beta-barrel domain n=1 Tax=Dinghuibacter silviterrae TaxID=1539049 RepID=A0A4R8DV35_9BACT|nr:hypothetical protein [Dinghuibacter silviterrae]TDX02264.1 hypothetical protein EDB95_3319 [Dinghuibacter silviterrae]